MNNWKRSVEFCEYDSLFFHNNNKDLRKEMALKSSKFDVTKFELSIAIAKGILTKTSQINNETIAFARSYFDIIDYVLDEKNGNLVFNYNNKQLLRDFTKTSFIGEISQGINYIYATRRLNADVIYDYSYFTKNFLLANIPQKNKTPDYVLHYTDGSYGILESKGTLNANPTNMIINGHSQCEQGECFLNSQKCTIKNSYVSAVSFGTSSMSPYNKRNTKLYCIDPTREDKKTISKDIKHLFYEYSKLFYLAGDIEAGNHLRNGEYLISDNYKKQNFKKNEIFIIGSWPIYEYRSLEQVTIQIGLQRQVIDFLSGETDNLSNYAKNENDFLALEDGSYVLIVQ